MVILGGGDGLAAREVLRYPDVESLTLVELDPDLVGLARDDPALSALNGGAHRDPRLRVETADAFTWLRDEGQGRRPYDVVISDLPDPGITPSTKLYSQEFFGLASRVLASGGRMAVHAGPLATRPRVYWTVDATLRAAGLRTRPYRTTGRLSGFVGGPDRDPGTAVAPHDWASCSTRGARARPRPRGRRPRLRSLTPAVLRAGERSAQEARVPGVVASTLVHPRYAH